jgi:hypothetical protein
MIPQPIILRPKKRVSEAKKGERRRMKGGEVGKGRVGREAVLIMRRIQGDRAYGEQSGGWDSLASTSQTSKKER